MQLPGANLRSEKGFTLIELLTVLTVLSVLSALAISQFDQYRKRAFDSRAEHDLRKAITSEEAYFADNDQYIACTGTQCETELAPFALSKGVELEMRLGEEGDSFQGSASHPTGLRRFVYNSATGEYRVSGS